MSATRIETIFEEMSEQKEFKSLTLKVELGEHILRVIKKDIARDYNLSMVPEADEVGHEEIGNADVIEYLHNLIDDAIKGDYFLAQYWKDEGIEWGNDMNIEESKQSQIGS